MIRLYTFRIQSIVQMVSASALLYSLDPNRPSKRNFELLFTIDSEDIQFYVSSADTWGGAQMHPNLLRAVIVITGVLIYLTFVYQPWSTIDEFRSGALSLLILAAFSGMVISFFSLPKNYLDTFFVSCPVPIICYFIEFSVLKIVPPGQIVPLEKKVVSSAHAFMMGGPPEKVAMGGPIELGTIDGSIGIGTQIIYMVVLSFVFGLLCVFGHYIAVELQKRLRGLFLSPRFGIGQSENAELKAARFAAYCTLISGVLGMTATIVSAAITASK